MPDEPVTIAERYSRAIKSDHLRMNERVAGDVDLLIAAGWVHDSMAMQLYRLAVEFDLVRGEIDRVRNNYVPAAQALAEQQEAALVRSKTRMHGPTQAAMLVQQAEADRLQAIKQARAFALERLKSLHSTAAAFGDWSCLMARKQKHPLMQDDARIKKLAGRVLDTWIDSRCDRCSGTGMLLVGGITQKCSGCRGSGNRTAMIGFDADERQFARFLFAEMDRRTSGVDAALRKFMSTRRV